MITTTDVTETTVLAAGQSVISGPQDVIVTHWVVHRVDHWVGCKVVSWLVHKVVVVVCGTGLELSAVQVMLFVGIGRGLNGRVTDDGLIVLMGTRVVTVLVIETSVLLGRVMATCAVEDEVATELELDP